MPFTYSVNDALTTCQTLVKGVNISSANQIKAADLVSNEMYGFYPWSWTVVAIASGTIALVDGTQDYSPPPNIYRLLRARIVRTDVTPNQFRDLNVQDNLVPDLTKRSPNNVGAISIEPAAGQLRLEAAVSIASGQAFEIQGEYQVTVPKITATTQGLWFPDEYQDVFMSGVLHWFYKFSDDPRAGGAVTDGQGRVSYSGQYGDFRARLQKMAANEDFGGDEQMFPSEPMGVGRNISITGSSIYGV